MLAWVLFMLAWSGCSSGSKLVVVYTSQDHVYAEPLLKKFTDATGIQTKAVYDSEAVKTVGLANRLIAERDRPQCDVFWSNEELLTRRLLAAGVFRQRDGWYAMGYRSRRLVYNTNHVAAAHAPRSLADLTNSTWRGRVAVAYPLFGTTATHFAALRQSWGEEKWNQWCKDLLANQALIVDGNSVVAKLVSSGEAWVGLTDSDDATVQMRRGAPLAMVDLTQDMLLIRNSVGIIERCAHVSEAEQLAAFLCSQPTTQALVRVNALEGEDPAKVAHEVLQPEWDRLLKDLEDTTKKLKVLFLR